jgi:hypothetical protein
MASPPPSPPAAADALDRDLLAEGRAALERACGHFRVRHLYPAGADPALLVLAIQELDRQRVVGRVRSTPRALRRRLRAIVGDLVARDAVARDRRLRLGLPMARPPTATVIPQVVRAALVDLDPSAQATAQRLIDPLGKPSALLSREEAAAVQRVRDALVTVLLERPEALASLHPSVVALIASAQPTERRHPLASYLFVKLPLQLVLALLTLLNVAYVGAYFFFNDEVLGRFISQRVSGMLEGELVLGRVHWSGRLALDLATGQPHHVVVEDVTVYEPHKSYGGEKRIAAYVERVEATIVLHEIVPWNRLGIPPVLEIPWALHFADVAMSGNIDFSVRGYRAQREDTGATVSLIGLRDAFQVYEPVPNDKRGLSFAVDAASFGPSKIDVDFREDGGWRFASDLDALRFALRFVSLDPAAPIPAALPLQFDLEGAGGVAQLDLDDITLPIESLDHLAASAGTGRTPFGDVTFELDAKSAGSQMAVDGRLRHAFARARDPATEPVAYNSAVKWGPSPLVELRAATRDGGGIVEHVLAELELPDYAVDAAGAAVTARVEGPLDDPTYGIAADGVSIDTMDEPAWVIDDALVSLRLGFERAPQRWSEVYPSKRLVATFDTFEGTALGGTVRLADGQRATVVLAGDEREPMLLDADLDVTAVNPGALTPDDVGLAAMLAGEASGRLRIDELRLGPVATIPVDGGPSLTETGLQRLRLELSDFQIVRDRGPGDDGLPKRIDLGGAVTLGTDGGIDWRELAIAIDGASLQSSGAIDGDFSELAPTELAVRIDDGAAFARALAIGRYVESLSLGIDLWGPLGAPSSREGRLQVTPTTGAVTGATDTQIRLDDGVLFVRGEDVRLLGGRGRVRAEARLFERGAPSDDPRIRAVVSLRDVPLSGLSGRTVGGIASIELEVGDGKGGVAPLSELKVTGTAKIPELTYGGSTFSNATIAFRWTAEQLDIDQLVLPLHRDAWPSEDAAKGVEVGRLVVDGSIGLGADLDLDLRARASGIPLSAVGAMLDTPLPVKGQIGEGTAVHVGGTAQRPSVDGKVALVGLAAFGLPLGGGVLEVESNDAPAQGELAARRELWVKGELSTGPRGEETIDWSIDALVALGKAKRKRDSAPIAAQLDVSFDRVDLPSVLGAAGVTLPGIEGKLDGLAAHVLVCDPGAPMLSDCVGTASDGSAASKDDLALRVSLDRAWIRPTARSTVARSQKATAKTPCAVRGTLCVEGLSARLEGDTLALERPVALRSGDGTDAQVAGTFDLSVAPQTPATAAPICRAPPPPAPKVAGVATASARATADANGRATVSGRIALGSLQAFLAPYGLATAKGALDVDLVAEGPIAAPKVSGRLDSADGTLWLQPTGVPFPIELADVAVAIDPQWLAVRGEVRVFGETLSIGSHGGERTGFAWAGPCAGHFDVAADGTIGTKLLATFLGEGAATAEGGVDIEQAFVSGTASPFTIDRAAGVFGFEDRGLRLRVTDGLDPIALTAGRIAVGLCSGGKCKHGVPDGALEIRVGDPPENRRRGLTPPNALQVEIGTRGRAWLWGEAYLDGESFAPLHTDFGARLTDVAYRDFDARGRLVAEAELSADELSIRGTEPIVLHGDIELARARYVKDAIQGADILAFADDVETIEAPPPDLIRSLQFDLRVTTDDPLRVDNNVAAGIEANASVNVSGSYDAPELTGRIDLESGGRVDLPFLTGTYSIQRGRVNLLGAIEDAEVDIDSAREEPVYINGQARNLQLALEGTLAEIRWSCITDGEGSASGPSARSCFDYLVLGTADVEVSDADVRRFGGGGLSEARKPLQVVGHVTEFDLDARAEAAVPRLRGYVPDMKLRLGQIGPELRIATPADWFDFDYGRLSFGWDYTRGYPGFFLRQSRQLTFRFELLDPITIEFSRRIRSYLNQRVIFDPLTQRTIEMRFDFTLPSAK